VLAGCNRLFGLGDVGERDANVHFFDAPVDAAPQCPPLGTSAPTFRPAVHSLPIASCTYYSISEVTHHAMARCFGASGYFSAEGELEGDLQQATTEDVAFSYSVPRMGADGDLIARSAYYYNPPMSYYTVEIQQRIGPLAWSRVGDLPYQAAEGTVVGYPFVSNPTTGSEPHVVVVESLAAAPARLHDLARISGTWQQVDDYPVSLVSTGIYNPSLSPDGLRMVFTGPDGVDYSDRATIHDRFRQAQGIDGIPPLLDAPVMTTDCGKLYFTALNTVLYLEQ
jgi:hypothetical protein